MVAPVNMSVSVFTASLLALVFMVFPLASFCGGVCSGCSVSRAARSCLHVWMCGFGAECHVGGEYRFARVT